MADTNETTRDTREQLSGQDALRENGMMLHLLDSLASGEDIGHYGRLVFTMVARHFLEEDELIELLLGDPATDEEQAVTLLEQVKARDYSPPRREKILQFQAQQDFAIIPNPDDPDATAEQRMPAIMDDSVLPDMGRMDG